MAHAKPYYTTDQLIESVQRRISYPLSQNTFQYSDIVAFLNEELQLSAVPAVKIEHEEYFVFKRMVPLVDGISRYEIPDRAIGMALRDVKYSDPYGNFYDMTRIAPDDKAFFQQSNGSNQTIAKYYLEGNELVLTPQVQAGATGYLNFFVFLRPNSLVRDDRARTILNYQKEFIIENSNLQIGDEFIINTGVQSPYPDANSFSAISASSQVISTVDTSRVITLASPHNLTIGTTTTVTLFDISGSTSTPALNNATYTVTVTGANTLELPASVSISVGGTGGNVVYPNQFLIGSTSINTATKLAVTINAANITNVTATNTSTASSGKILVAYKDISVDFETVKGTGYLRFTTAALTGPVSAGDTYTDANNNVFTVYENASLGATSIILTGTGASPVTGTLTLLTGSGPSIITYSLYGVIPSSFTYDANNIYINFDAQLSSTYTDPQTDITTPFFVPGQSYVDFLQTNPGHRTYTYDVKLLSVSGTVGVFAADDLKTYAQNSSGGQLTYLNIKVGDYICLQNECIIPQIPPELHNALAERAASRILMAIGDVQGYQISQAKIAEMNKMQETLIGSRIESSVPKVFNRYSLLRLGKSRFRRRY